MICKQCSKELIKGIDYCGKLLCKKCYLSSYIKNKWATNPDYRKKQYKRILKWQKANPKRVKEIANKCYKNKNK
jgi:hypothetical protein